MATKRSFPDDFETPPIESKQYRSDGQIVVPMSSVAFSTPPFVTTSSGDETRQPICTSLESKIRSKITRSRQVKLDEVKMTYNLMLKEKFFLEDGGNFMDYQSWKKRPNVLRDKFLKQHDLDGNSNDFGYGSSSVIENAQAIVRDIPADVTQKQLNKSPRVKKIDDTSLITLPSATTVQIPLSTVSPNLQVTPPKGSVTPMSPSRSMCTFSPQPSTRAHTTFSSVYDNSHEDIVMRARHEAEVMKAISELRKEGLWSCSRLPKVQEPVRVKTHWDYLLEEMQWLAADFVNEKRWKINAARKVKCTTDYGNLPS